MADLSIQPITHINISPESVQDVSEQKLLEPCRDEFLRHQVGIMRLCLKAGSGTPPTKSKKKRERIRRQMQVKSSPRLPTLRGQGDYSFAEKAGRAVGGFVGRTVDQLIDHLGISGFGDYTVKQNSLLAGGLDPPAIVNDVANGGVIVRHREYIGDVYATEAFTNTSYDINPGLQSTFPWLAQIAESFEQYRLLGMVMEFKSMSSDTVLSTSTNSALGSVIMATQYNVLDAPFVDKRTMENYTFASSCKPSQSILHPIECAPSQTTIDNLYIRTGVVPTGADQRMYDIGSFQIATVGMQANGGVIGELWISFEAALYKPKLLLGDILTDHYQLGTVSNGAPLGTTSLLVGTSTLGTTITGAGLIITFPASVVDGNFKLDYTCFGTGAAVTQLGLPSQFNCAALRVWENDTNLYEGTRTGTTTNLYSFSQLIQIQGPSATLTFAAGVLPTVVTHGDLWISQIAETVAT